MLEHRDQKGKAEKVNRGVSLGALNSMLRVGMAQRAQATGVGGPLATLSQCNRPQSSFRPHQFFRVDTGLAPRAHAWGLCFFKVKLATLHIVQNHGTNTNPLETHSTNPILAAKPPPLDHASCLSALGTSFEQAAPIPPSMKASLSVCLPGNLLRA